VVSKKINLDIAVVRVQSGNSGVLRHNVNSCTGVNASKVTHRLFGGKMEAVRYTTQWRYR
jgi:hypothetical protein